MNNTNITIDELVNALNELTDDDFNEPYDGDDGDYGMRYSRSTEKVGRVEWLACELLITSRGGCNWDNIRALREHGFQVFPGETDSFGWITGCIGLQDDKVVVYG